MDYQQYSVEDFILDEAFRKWVLDPDQASRTFWNQWLDDHPHKAETVARAIELLKQIPMQQDRLSEQQIASITQAIEEGIDRWEDTEYESAEQERVIPINAYAATQQRLETSLPKKSWFKSWLPKIAVCTVLVLTMLYLAYHEGLFERQPEIVYEQVVKENPKGQKLTVFLPDGTRVILNAGSSISFTKPFHPDKRILTLEGEAFFEVAKDSLRPFQVISGALITTALGTSFNIAAYPDDDHIQVSLTSGKVKVDYQQATAKQEPEVFYLSPGEQLAYDKEQHSLAKVPFDADHVLSWKEGVIYLKNADQATVVKTLERWYGIQVSIEGKSAAAWDLTARFDNQSLKSVLTSLGYTMGFMYEIKEDHVIIKYS